MEFRAVFRELASSDVSRDCPYMPEPGEFELHFRAIAQDVSALEGVSVVSRQDERTLIITTDGLDLEALKSGLKPVLQCHFQYARLSGIGSFVKPPCGIDA